MVVENYKPRIDIDPEWEMVELGSLCSIKHGFAFKSEDFIADGNSNLPIVLAPGNYNEAGGLTFTTKNTRRFQGLVDKEYLFREGDLTIVMTDLSPMMKILGNPAIIESKNILHNQRIGKFIFKSNLIQPKYLYYSLFLPSIKNRIKQTATGTLIRHTSPDRILECVIPLPPLKTQRQIVSQIEQEQQLVNANKQLIELFEKKVKERIAKVWGE
jgi:restriction endonuclease S subunit